MNPDQQDPSRLVGVEGTTMVVDALPTDSEQMTTNAVTPPATAPRPAPGPHRRSVVAHLLSGLGMALARPRVLLALICCSLLLALPTAVTVYRDALDGVALLVENPNDQPFDFLWVAPDWIFGEWQRSSPGLSRALGSSITPSIIASSLFGLLVCAGYMGIAASRRREHSLLSFLREGGTWFFPFLRTWLFALPMFFAVTWLFWSTPGEWLMKQLLPEGKPELAASESIARWVNTSREVFYLLFLLIVEVSIDLGRAAMVVGRRSSALLAILRGIGQFMFEPLRALGLVGFGFALELAWIAGCIELARRGLVPMWSLALLLPFGRFCCRGARYAGLVGLVRETRTSSLDLVTEVSEE